MDKISKKDTKDLFGSVAARITLSPTATSNSNSYNDENNDEDNLENLEIRRGDLKLEPGTENARDNYSGIDVVILLGPRNNPLAPQDVDHDDYPIPNQDEVELSIRGGQSQGHNGNSNVSDDQSDTENNYDCGEDQDSGFH